MRLFSDMISFALPVIHGIQYFYRAKLYLIGCKNRHLVGTIQQKRSVQLLSFFKTKFFHRVDDPYSFWTLSSISKGMFILVFLLHIGEKPFKCIRVVLFLHTKLILKPKFIFLNMYPYVKKSFISIVNNIKKKVYSMKNHLIFISCFFRT